MGMSVHLKIACQAMRALMLAGLKSSLTRHWPAQPLQQRNWQHFSCSMKPKKKTTRWVVHFNHQSYSTQLVLLATLLKKRNIGCQNRRTKALLQWLRILNRLNPWASTSKSKAAAEHRLKNYKRQARVRRQELVAKKREIRRLNLLWKLTRWCTKVVRR